MAEEVYRIDVTVQVQDKYSNELKSAEREVSRFEQRMKKTERQLERMNRSRWRLMLSAVDRASHVINRVGMFADRVARRSYRIAIRAVDMFTAPVRSMLSSMGGILATAGIVGGTAGGLILPIKLQVERQNIETAFEVLLGSADAAKQRVAELIEFAGQTPYTRDEIFQASRVLEVFTRGALSTGDGLKMVGDIAAGTQNEFERVAFWVGRLYDALESGRPIGEMLMRLQEMGALTGEGRERIEKLAKSGQDITRIWPEVAKEFSRFDGMMERMSQNLGNLLLSVKSFWTNNIMMRWGKGLDSVLSPLLTDFRNWRKENSDLIEAMGDSIEQAGRRFAGFFDTIFRSVGRNFDELIRLPEFQEADFIGKLKLSWDRLITQPLSEWWESGGQDQVGRIMGNIGHFIGSSLNAVIMSALGLAGVEGSDAGSVYKDIGTTAGRSFLEGFLEGFDANEVTKKLWEAFKNIQPSFLGGQTQSLGGTIMALLFDAWLLTTIGRIFKGPITLGRGLFRGVRRGWNVGKDVFGRMRDMRRGGTKGPLRDSPLLPNIPKLPGGITRFATRVPIVGPALGLFTLGATPKEELPGTIGSIGGGMAGAAAGAAIGSVIPGIGTLVGGLIGGILGSFGGEKIGEWLGNIDFSRVFDNIKDGASSAAEWVSTKWNESITWISGKWSDLSNWFYEKVWTPISDGAINTINFFVGLWDLGRELVTKAWGPISDWFRENVWTPIVQMAGAAALWIGEKYGEAKEWLTEKWTTLSEWFVENVWTPITESVSAAAEWVSEKFNAAKEWIQENWGPVGDWFYEEIWTPIMEASAVVSEWINEKFEQVKVWIEEQWSPVSDWFAENVWDPIKTGVESATEWIKSKFEEAKTWVQDIWSSITGWFSDITERGSRVTGLKTSKQRRAANLSVYSGPGPTPYADGGLIRRPHIGLVGEEGPEMIIPLSASRRNRALDLWMKTAKYLGVRQYADGGITSPTAPVDPVSTTKRGNINIMVNVGGISVKIPAEKIDTTNKKETAEEIAFEISRKLQEVFGNMPIVSTN